MAGSYKHVIDDQGRLLSSEDFPDMIENLGDAYEAIEEMYGMIWYLADQISPGDLGGSSPYFVQEAAEHYRAGIERSPGVSPPREEDEDGNDYACMHCGYVLVQKDSTCSECGVVPEWPEGHGIKHSGFGWECECGAFGGIGLRGAATHLIKTYGEEGGS